MPAQMPATPTRLRIPGNPRFPLMKQPSITSKPRQSRTVRLHERQPLQMHRLRPPTAPADRIRKRLLEFPSRNMLHAHPPKHRLVHRSIKPEARQAHTRIQPLHLFDTRDRHARRRMHRQMEPDPVRPDNRIRIEPIPRKIRHRHLMPFGPQPRRGRRQPKRLMAQIVRRDKEDSHPWFHYRPVPRSDRLWLWYNGLVTNAQDETRTELVHAMGQIRHLKDTIVSMRAQMEEMRAEEQRKGQQTLAAANGETVQLRQTVSRMREELEKARAEERQKAQHAVAGAHEEALQLRATVQALRDAMETQKLDYEAKMQSAQTLAREEIRQLRLTVAELRTQLEKRNDAGA